MAIYLDDDPVSRRPTSKQFEGFGPQSPRRVTRLSSRSYGEGQDDYKYAKEDPQAITGWSEHQHLTVLHTSPQASYALRTPGRGVVEQGNTFTSTAIRRMGQAHDELRETSAGGQRKLFGMGYTPGKSTVDYMAGTREGRTMALTMLGIAQNDTQREYGRSLSPSENLSEHSSQLVGHMREKGIVPKGEGGEVHPPITNDMQFRDWSQTHFRETGERDLPHEEVMAGRRTSRQMLRQAKPRARPPQPVQGSLF